MKNIYHHKILILNFGSQYTQLIARRIRDIGVYCELVEAEITEQEIKDFAPTGIILSGGPESTTKEGCPVANDYVFKAGVPVLGICYGMQTMAKQLGGATSGEFASEFGDTKVTVVEDDAFFKGLKISKEKKDFNVWMSHEDQVTKMPKGFKVLAKTDICPIAVMADHSKKFYAVQFHPEVTHTKDGLELIKNFVLDICGCERNWSSSNIAQKIISSLKEEIKEDEVLLGLSGGVDSAVTAMLLHKAIGDRLKCVLVDNGLLRLNEAVQIEEVFDKLGIKIIKVDAQKQFLSALKGVREPEEKRKIIGKIFIDVFEKTAKKFKKAKYLAQGTIYSDVIESAGSKSGKAQVIKSHHNVGGLPELLKLDLVEPLRELFKDEVRKLGTHLGLPKSLLQRHPFPGPGLGVRVLGEVKAEYCDLLRRADAIFIEELIKANWYKKVSQAFVVFLPVKSVGVMGDMRKYDWVLSLRAVKTIDFMTAQWAELPYKLLATVSNRILNEIPGISRVVYDISGKPPATIEWE